MRKTRIEATGRRAVRCMDCAHFVASKLDLIKNRFGYCPDRETGVIRDKYIECSKFRDGLGTVIDLMDCWPDGVGYAGEGWADNE